MQTLLLPKFHQPPLPSHAVARLALLARLHDGLAAKRSLTLIAAAAGYGKTTLAAQWTAQLTSPVVWLTLEVADDDPLRFCTYLVAALQRLHPSIGMHLLPVLRAGQLPPQNVLLTTLLNDLDTAYVQQQAEHGGPFVCVLDDAHAIQHPQNLRVIEALLAHPSSGLHLVLVAREDPALPLARLRARAHLTEVRAADLRLSETEAATLLGAGMGLTLATSDLVRLHQRTEGWAVGLHLAGLSLQDRADPAAFVAALSGSHRFILGYLTEEVLARQPADRQQFLLETSLLTRLHGDLCDAVTGRNDSAELLEELLRANLFLMPLDDEGRWYRYHQLFAELLQHKLRRASATLPPVLHLRASQWYERQGMPATSVKHALAAGDEQRVATLLVEHGWHLLTREHTPLLLQWLAALPEALRQRNPQLNTIMVWGSILRGNYQQAAPYLAAAQATLEHMPPEASATRALHADILALRSFLAQAQGQAAQALTCAEHASSLVPPDHARLRASTALALGVAYRVEGRCAEAIEALEAALHAAQMLDDHVTAMVALAHLALIWLPLGRLHRLVATAEAAIERTETISRVAPLMIGTVHAVIGNVYYEWNQVAKARAMLLHGLRMAQLADQPASLIYVSTYLARLHQESGDLPTAASYLRAAGDVLARGAPAWAHLDWLAQRVVLLVAQGNLAEAEASLSATGITPATPVGYATDAIHLAWLRWQIASRHPHALALAKRIVQSAEAEGRNGTLIQALVLGAPAGGGQAWLIRARQLGEPEGYQRIFMNAERAPHTTPELIEPLTERERDVLRLLASGLTYAQIAEELLVSINTVRYHVKGVYGKLGVEKQVQAIERGRALGLLQ